MACFATRSRSMASRTTRSRTTCCWAASCLDALKQELAEAIEGAVPGITVHITAPGEQNGGDSRRNVVNCLAVTGGVGIQIEQQPRVRDDHARAVANAVADVYAGKLESFAGCRGLDRLSFYRCIASTIKNRPSPCPLDSTANASPRQAVTWRLRRRGGRREAQLLLVAAGTQRRGPGDRLAEADRVASLDTGAPMLSNAVARRRPAPRHHRWPAPRAAVATPRARW